MKKKIKKIASILLIALMLVGGLRKAVSILEVDALEPNVGGDFKLTNVSDDFKLNLSFDNEEEVVLDSDNADYKVESCNEATGNGVLDILYTPGEKGCRVKPKNYGVTMLDVYVKNISTEETYKRRILTNADTDKLMDRLIELVPDEFYGTTDELYRYIYSNVNITNGLSVGTSGDDLTVTYGYYDLNNTWQMISRTKKVKINSPRIPTIGYPNMTVGDFKTPYINFDSYPETKPENVMFVSLNNTIATVDQTGKINAKMPGQVEIRLYDKRTLNYTTTSATIYPVDADIQTILDSIEKEVIIDVAAYNISFYSDIESQYPVLANYFMDDYVKSHFNNEYLSRNVNCNGNVCQAIVYKYDDNGGHKTFTSPEFKIIPRGIGITTTGFTTSPKNSGLDLDYYAKTYGGVTITDIKYDSEYLTKDENGYYSSTEKTGVTEIEFIGTDENGTRYMNKLKVTINGDSSNKAQEMYNYYQGVNSVALPYRSLDFQDDMTLLSNVVKNQVYDTIPDEEIKAASEVTAKCTFKDSCFVDITYQSAENGYDYGYKLLSKVIKVTYNDLNTDNSIEKIKAMKDKIATKHLVSFEDTIRLEASVNSSEEFYNNLINSTNIKTLIAEDDSITYNVSLKDTNSFSEHVNGSATYSIDYSIGGKKLYTGTVLVASDHIIGMSHELSNEENARIDYIKNVIKGVINKDVDVQQIEEKNYKVSFENKSFNVILDQKEAIEIESIALNSRLIILNSGSTEKISYTTYPTFSNSGTMKYTSNDETIATVSEDGTVTGVKKGYTSVRVKYKNASSQALVLVDMTAEEFLTEVRSKVTGKVTLDYASIYNSLEDSIANEVNNSLYKYYSNLSGLLRVNVLKEGEDFYVKVGVQQSNNWDDVFYGEKQKIEYELKGIKIDSQDVRLNSGETYNLHLFFSEGDYRNIVYDIEDESIATISARGVITAKKTGVTYINMSDKYGQYYNYVKVVVNGEEYFNNNLTEIKKSPVIIYGKEYTDRFMWGNSNQYIIEDLFSSSVTNSLDSYNFYNTSNTVCDETKKECTITFKQVEHDTGETLKELKETLKYELRGVFIDSGNTKLEVGKTAGINYKVYPEGSSVNIESLDTSIATVDSTGKVTALKKGIAPIKFSHADGISYHLIVVDENGMIEDFQNAFNNISNQITVYGEKYEPLYNSNNYKEEAEHNALYNVAISEHIESEMAKYYNKPSENFEYQYMFNLNDLGTKDSLNISLNLSYCGNDEANSDYTYFYYPFDAELEKQFNFTYSSVSEDLLQTGKEIKRAIKDKYELSLIETLRYQLASPNSDAFALLAYSSVIDDIKNACPTCTYKVDQFSGSGMGDVDFVQSSFPLVIYKDGYPITTKYVEITARFVVDADKELNTEIIVGIIKEEVKKAYLEMKDKLFPSKPAVLSSVSFFGLRTMQEQSEAEDVIVTVEKQVESTNGYDITIEDKTLPEEENTLKFEANVGINYTGTVEYTQDPIKAITLNKKSIALLPDETATLTATLTTEGEADKTIKWTTSDANIATVDEAGNVTAHKVGTATITAEAANGMTAECSITVDTFKKGDLDGNGTISIKDAIEALYYVVGKYGVPDDVVLKIGDMNEDGKITIGDAIAILKLYIG